MVGGFQGDTVAKNMPISVGDARDTGAIPELGTSPGVGCGNPLQYSCLEDSMDRGAWQATVHGVSRVGPDLSTKPSQPELGQEKGMIPGKGENKILNTQLLNVSPHLSIISRVS